MPQLASAGGELVDPRGEQLMAFRIAERAHGASQTPAVSEVMVHRGLFLLVRVPPVPFPASGLSPGAFLLEAFPVPHRQHPPAGIAEFVYHVRGAALVSDVQVHGPVTLLLAVLRHKGGGSSRPGSPRKRHHLVLLKNSAHTVDANLQKHTESMRRGFLDSRRRRSALLCAASAE